MKQYWTSLKPMFIALGLALLIGAVLMLISASNPLEAYAAIIGGAFGPAGWSTMVATAIPIVGCALAVSIPFRAGLINLGGEGQLVAGGISAVVVATILPDMPSPLALVLAVAAGAAVGALVGLLPAIMETKLGVPLLISSLLLSYPLVALASFLVRFPLLDQGTGLPQTPAMPEAYRMPVFGEVTGALFVMLAVIAVAVIVDRMMPAGFEIRLTGKNRNFTQYTGVAITSMTHRVMAAGGASAGLVGALIVTAFPFRFIDGALIAPGFVWTGLLAAMLARGNPIGVVIAAVFFTALEVGGAAMERETLVPRELSSILQATVIILLAGALALRARKNQKVA